MFRRIAALAAVPALTLATLVAPTAASANPVADCNWVPLKYSKTFSTGGEHWRTKADLKVYDLCEDGTIRGNVYIDAHQGSSDGDIKPWKPVVAYQRHNDTSYRATGVRLTSKAKKSGWKPYGVTTSDIYLHAGWFMGVRISWTVTVNNRKYTKTVTCDRIQTEGDDAYTCH